MRIRTTLLSALSSGLILSGSFIAASPASATICNDGTYSSSVGQGTCSWHGGVDTWSPGYSGGGSSSGGSRWTPTPTPTPTPFDFDRDYSSPYSDRYDNDRNWSSPYDDDDDLDSYAYPRNSQNPWGNDDDDEEFGYGYSSPGASEDDRFGYYRTPSPTPSFPERDVYGYSSPTPDTWTNPYSSPSPIAPAQSEECSWWQFWC